jgi:hypothetical protein
MALKPAASTSLLAASKKDELPDSTNEQSYTPPDCKKSASISISLNPAWLLEKTRTFCCTE